MLNSAATKYLLLAAASFERARSHSLQKRFPTRCPLERGFGGRLDFCQLLLQGRVVPPIRSWSRA